MTPLQIIVGDCRETLKTLPDESVQCCVTSPPYWGLRDYGHPDQIGAEKTYPEFIENMQRVFLEVHRILKPDGVLWLNLGDCYATGAGAVGNCPGGGEQGERWRGNRGDRPGSPKHADTAVGMMTQANRLPQPGLKPKDLVGIPWRVAFALQEAGWYLRSDIIWSKPNPMPESVTDRPTKAHEYIFLLTKSERYFYNHEAIKEPVAQSSVERLSQDVENQIGSFRVPGKTNGAMKAVGRGGKNAFRGQGSNRDTENGGANREGRDMQDIGTDATRNKRSVWNVATQPYKGAHFATYPPDLIKPCIMAGSRPGDTILDPFGGSGTTGEVSLSLGRKAILCELNPDYAKLAEARTETTLGLAL